MKTININIEKQRIPKLLVIPRKFISTDTGTVKNNLLSIHKSCVVVHKYIKTGTILHAKRHMVILPIGSNSTLKPHISSEIIKTFNYVG